VTLVGLLLQIVQQSSSPIGNNKWLGGSWGPIGYPETDHFPPQLP